MLTGKGATGKKNKKVQWGKNNPTKPLCYLKEEKELFI